jgi:hypothetical protein
VCVTWESSSGKTQIYKDGVLSEIRFFLQTGTQIKGGGIWVIGQDQDSLRGGFQAIDSFKGILTEVNIWNRVLGSDEIKSFANDCGWLVQGNYKVYSDFTTHFTDMCIPHFFSLPNGVRRSTFDTSLVTKFGAFSSFHQYFCHSRQDIDYLY